MLVVGSEIRISAIVNYVQHVEIVTAFCMPGGLVKSFIVWET